MTETPTTAPSDSPEPPELLKVAEVAARLRVSPMTVRRWISAGDLPTVAAGPRTRRVSVEDLDAYLAAAGATSTWSVSTPMGTRL